MRRRLTIAIVSVVAATLAATAAGSLFLVRHAATSTAQSELAGEAQAIAAAVSTGNARVTRPATIRLLDRIGGYATLGIVGVSTDGMVVPGLPRSLSTSLLNVPALLSSQAVMGNEGHVVFAAVPLSLTSAQRRSLAARGIPLRDSPVLLVTRAVRSPFNGLPYFVLVAATALAMAAMVAAILARRTTAPLLQALDATNRIASGHLDARVPTTSRDYPEIAQLSSAINAMGDSLARARDQERQFLLSVSHELRTPLTSIRGYADALVDGATEDVAGAAAVIAGESRRLERLVQDLLDLARLDSRHFSLHIERIDCTEVVRELAGGFMPEAAARNLCVTEAIPEEGPLWVDADRDRLAQMVANLIENALRFASHQVVVGTGPVGSSVAIWVVDDGPGIPATEMPSVFDRHYSSDRAAGAKLGSGLGLAIVAELAQAMGATVRAESPVAEERGTRMVIWLRPAAVCSTRPAGRTPAK